MSSETQADLIKKLNKVSFKFGEKKELSLCYETWDIYLRKYEPQLITRYPHEDWDYYPLPSNLMQFIFTSGLRVEKEDQSNQKLMTPNFFNLILTNEEGNRVFVSVLTLKENPFDP